MGELKLVVKNKSGEIKSGFKQTRVKGKINKYDLKSSVLTAKVTAVKEDSWISKTEMVK